MTKLKTLNDTIYELHMIALQLNNSDADETEVRADWQKPHHAGDPVNTICRTVSQLINNDRVYGMWLDSFGDTSFDVEAALERDALDIATSEAVESLHNAADTATDAYGVTPMAAIHKNTSNLAAALILNNFDIECDAVAKQCDRMRENFKYLVNEKG